MIHPLPPGTRDVLPQEMRELRGLSDRLRRSFEAAGYDEVWTPALEYEEVLRRGDDRAPATAAYRLFDDHGRVLVLRWDNTVPIARMAASRLADVAPPLRLCYFAHAYRAIERGRGQTREFLQGGIELLGAEAPGGEAEVVALVARALEEAGLARHRIALGDAGLFPSLLEHFEVPPAERVELLEAVGRRDLVGLAARVARLGLGAEARGALVTLPGVRGGPEVLERLDPVAPEAAARLRACLELVGGLGAADRVIVDLGLSRELGYYTGAVFEVYDPAVGFALGGGGRYDELMGRFGRSMPACGLALDLQRVHVAQAEEERLA